MQRLTTCLRFALRNRRFTIPLLTLLVPAVAIQTSLGLDHMHRQQAATARAAEFSATMDSYGKRVKEEAARVTEQHLKEQQARADQLQVDNDAKQAELDAKQAEIDAKQAEIDRLKAQIAYRGTPTGYGGGGSPRPAVVAGNHFPYGQCTYWVATKRNVPWFGNAGTWLLGAQAYGYATGSTPRPGAIVVTAESPIGHVAYVESVGSGSFTVSEMNYRGVGVVDWRTIALGSGFVRGFIY